LLLMGVVLGLLVWLLVWVGGFVGGGRSWASLAITVYPHGIGQPGFGAYVLRCGPAAGTVPNPVLACRTLSRLADPFAPVPPQTFCTTLALGPEEALVRGRLRGQAVDAHLSVRGGCEIERWRHLADVVPGFPGPH
jgi:hypothetical protein